MSSAESSICFGPIRESYVQHYMPIRPSLRLEGSGTTIKMTLAGWPPKCLSVYSSSACNVLGVIWTLRSRTLQKIALSQG